MDKLQELIADGKTKEAIDWLMVELQDTAHAKEVVMIAHQYKRLMRKAKLGVLGHGQESIGQNLVIAKLLEVASDVTISADGRTEPNTALGIASRLSRRSVLGMLGVALATVFISIMVGTNAQYLWPWGKTASKLVFEVVDVLGRPIRSNTGRLWVAFDDKSWVIPITAGGKATLTGVNLKPHETQIQITYASHGYRIVDSYKTRVYKGMPIMLAIEEASTLGNISGVVLGSASDEPIANAFVRIANDTVISTDQYGMFSIVLPRHMQVDNERKRYQLTISKRGYKPHRQDVYPNAHETEIRLDKL